MRSEREFTRRSLRDAHHGLHMTNGRIFGPVRGRDRPSRQHNPHVNQNHFAYRPTMGREISMKRAKKRGRRGAAVVATGEPLVIGGVTPGSTRRPPGSSRTGVGRVARADDAKSKKSAARPKSGKTAASATPKASTARAQERWENEGGRTSKANGAQTAVPKTARRPVKKPSKSTAAESPTRSPHSTPGALDRDRQRRAEARVKGSKIKRAGLESRVLGHVSSRGKRMQARRDSKN